MLEQNGQKGGPHENEFQIQKWMLKTGKWKKVDEKIGVIPVVFMFSSWVMFFELSKKFLAVLCWTQQEI